MGGGDLKFYKKFPTSTLMWFSFPKEGWESRFLWYQNEIVEVSFSIKIPKNVINQSYILFLKCLGIAFSSNVPGNVILRNAFTKPETIPHLWWYFEWEFWRMGQMLRRRWK
jgi:hypothetical protein